MFRRPLSCLSSCYLLLLKLIQFYLVCIFRGGLARCFSIWLLMESLPVSGETAAALLLSSKSRFSSLYQQAQARFHRSSLPACPQPEAFSLFRELEGRTKEQQNKQTGPHNESLGNCSGEYVWRVGGSDEDLKRGLTKLIKCCLLAMVSTPQFFKLQISISVKEK